jgi:putative transposase
MPRRARTLQSENYFHVINRSSRKAPLFERSRDYREFLRILREGLHRHPVPLLAYCVMSNHWHLVVGPVGTDVLSTLLHWVTTTHAVRFHARRKTSGHGPVYQGRFKSHAIESAGTLLRTIRYVERNALAANLVKRAEDWPWGSLADRQRSVCALPLKGAAFLSSRSWIELVNANQLLEDAQPKPVPELWKSVETTCAEATVVRRSPARRRNRPVPLQDLADDPGAGKGGEKRGRVGGGRRNDQTHTHIERAKHLRVVKLPGPLQPLEQRRNRPALAIK